MKTLMTTRTSVLCLSMLAMTVVAAIVVPGCGPSRPRDPSFNRVLDTDTVVLHDKSLGSRLARQNEWTEMKQDFLEAHVVLRNLSGKTLHVEVLTYFKDSHNATLETPTDLWDPVTIQPREDFHYSRLCSVKGAEGYQFHIRLGKDS